MTIKELAEKLNNLSEDNKKLEIIAINKNDFGLEIIVNEDWGMEIIRVYP